MNAEEPKEGTWWRQNRNQKRYYLKQVHTFFDKRRWGWMHLEGTNQCLHVPVAEIVKKYTPVDTTGMKTVEGKI